LIDWALARRWTQLAKIGCAFFNPMALLQASTWSIFYPFAVAAAYVSPLVFSM